MREKIITTTSTAKCWNGSSSWHAKQSRFVDAIREKSACSTVSKTHQEGEKAGGGYEYGA